jgi:DNA-binding Xre family transcriptional regulator
MGASYNKLFKLLIDKKMRKGELCEAARISSSTMVKLSRGSNVNTEILCRLCYVLECDFGDIMEYCPDKTDLNIRGSGKGDPDKQ